MEIFKQVLLYLQLENTRIKKENKELKTELTDIKKEFKIDVLHFPDGTKDYRCRCWAETNNRMNTIRELIKDSLNKTNFDYEFLLNEIYNLTF